MGGAGADLRVLALLETTTPSGRVWQAETGVYSGSSDLQRGE